MRSQVHQFADGCGCAGGIPDIYRDGSVMCDAQSAMLPSYAYIEIDRVNAPARLPSTEDRCPDTGFMHIIATMQAVKRVITCAATISRGHA